MIFNTKIQNIYLLCGLALSGQDVFINWFLSLMNHSDIVYFFNNIKNISDLEPDNIKTLKTKIGSSDMLYDKGQIITHHDNREKLSTQIQYYYLLEGQIKEIQNLVIFIDDNPISILDIVANKFINSKNIYKIICIRDILNLFSNRIHNNSINNGTFYEHNMKTYGLYTNNLFSTKNNNYITFNFNKFLLESSFRKNLAQQLNLNYTPHSHHSFITNSNFKNMTSKQNTFNNIQKYFLIWFNYQNDQLINYMMYNNVLMDYMCNFFNFCFEDNHQILKIKNHLINLKKYKKLIQNN